MRALIALSLVLTACATLARGAPAGSSSGSTAANCEDNPHCLTSPDCSLDQARGCLACRCSDPMGPNPGIVNSESIPPLR